MAKKVMIDGKWPIVLPDNSANEWIGNMQHHNNAWELPRLLKLEHVIKAHNDGNGHYSMPIVMYIGAYKGDMPVLLQSWGVKLIVMESTPAFWTLIKEAWQLNNVDDPVGFFSGLVGRESSQQFSKKYLTTWPTRHAEYIEGKVGFTHLAESHDDPTFPRITIDDFVNTTGLVPDIITMDVEGSELEILHGGLETIEKHKPSFMLSVHPEFMFHNHGSYERELHDLLRDHKYVGEWLEYDHEHHWWYEVAK